MNRIVLLVVLQSEEIGYVGEVPSFVEEDRRSARSLVQTIGHRLEELFGHVIGKPAHHPDECAPDHLDLLVSRRVAAALAEFRESRQESLGHKHDPSAPYYSEPVVLRLP